MAFVSKHVTAHERRIVIDDSPHAAFDDFIVYIRDGGGRIRTLVRDERGRMRWKVLEVESPSATPTSPDEHAAFLIPRDVTQELVDALAAAGFTPTDPRDYSAYAAAVEARELVEDHRDDMRDLLFKLLGLPTRREIFHASFGAHADAPVASNDE